MPERQGKERSGCPFRICETVKREDIDAKRKRLIPGQEETIDGCSLCAAKVKERIEQEGK